MSKKDNLSDLRAHITEPKLNTDLPQDDIAASWLSAIIESADDAIVSKTLDGIIASWNRGAERIFGYQAEETVGKSVLMLIPPDHQNEEPEILRRIRAGERVDHYETIRRRKDGKLIDVSLTISPIKSADGRIIGASKVVRDISDRKKTEAILKEQTEIVETINRIGQVVSAELDQQTLVQSVTDAATELTGAQFGAFFYNVENEDGASYMLYTLSGVPRAVFDNFPMPRATDMFGPTFRGEGTIRIADVKNDARYGNNSPYYGMPDGHLPVTSYLAVSVTSRSGEVIGGLFFGHSEAGVFTERHEQIIEGIASQVAVAMDNARLYDRAQRAIREREELLRREQEARKQVEEASRAKDEFLGLISHEIRTPLNAILGWTRMLTSAKLDAAAVANAIETIDRNAKLQSRLIEDMLDISRVMTGKLRLDAQPTDLTTVISGAVESLRPAADARGIRIYSVLDYGAGLVLGDSTRLQQIIWNLLSNAIKFTPKGGSVKIYLERINSHLEITVSDTGPGIDAEFLPFVFERFRQADSSSTKKFGGLGLGLSIVRQLTELHGGTVEAANRSDRTGAVFTVKLPVMVARAKAEKAPENADSAAGQIGETVAFEFSPQLEGVRIIIVDDDADARVLLRAILEQCGAQLKVCESAAETLAALDEFKPDILVSDIGMPGEDGYSLIRKIRSADGEFRRIPAVALTAFARVEDRLKALAAGFNMHVPKPVEPAELTMVLASLVNNK